MTHAVVVEDDAQLHTTELRVGDFVREVGTAAEGEGVRWEDVLRRREDVGTIVLVQIVHRLVPDASKEGYEEGVGVGEASGSGERASRGNVDVGGGPLRGGGRVIDPLRDDGGLRVGGGGGSGGYGGVGGFGSDDLLAPGLAGGPGGMLGRMGGGGMGGNLMGPRNFMGAGWRGGDGRPQGVPPGARFDPYGPVLPDNDMERMPGFEDEHGLGLGGNGNGRGQGRGALGGAGRGARRGGGFGEGPPPGMYW